MKSQTYIMKTKLGLLICFAFVIAFLSQAQQQKLSPQLKALITDQSTEDILVFKDNAQLKATTIFSTHKKEMGLSTHDKMENYQTETDQLGYTTFKYQQYYKNIKVEYATVIVNEKDGSLKTMIGKCFQNINLNTQAGITEASALQYALNSINAQEYLWQHPANEKHLKESRNDPNATYYPKGELVIINDEYIKTSGKFRLAYKFEIDASVPLLSRIVYVDAHSGDVIYNFDNLQHADFTGSAKTGYSGTQSIMTEKFTSGGTDFYRLTETGRGGGIQTKNMNRLLNFTNVTDFVDDDNTWNNINANWDQYATDVHWASEMVYDYFLSRHERNSWDNAGKLMKVYVHYGNNYQNGFFRYADEAVFLGDGDNDHWPLTSMDWVGHEFTHGVTRKSCNLTYQGESGAINEGLSDIFAADIEFTYKAGNYLIFEETFTTVGQFERSMSDPKTGAWAQPDTYEGSNWKSTAVGAWDNGGVHINSGVMNKWFYLLSEGGSGKNDKGNKYEVKGIGRDKAIKIVYRAQTVKLQPNHQFTQAREMTIAAAKDLFPGDCSEEVLQTTNAWYAVGVGDPSIQIDSSIIEKSSCKEDNGSIWVRVKGVKAPAVPTYEWSNGETTQKIEDLAPEKYFVTITDPTSKCKVDSFFVVEEDVNFFTSIVKIDVKECGGDDGFATIAVAGAKGTPEILWSTGETTNSIRDLVKGWYYVTATDTSTNCEKKDSVEIKEPELKVRVVGGGPRTYCKGKPAPTVTLSAVTELCTGCQYNWSTGETTMSITVTSSGSYFVTVTNEDGCTGKADTRVQFWERDCDDDPTWEIPVVSPLDPNEIIGPAGYGPPRFVAKSASQPYTILFENDPDFATAPAIKVMVDAPFDPKTDMYSFRLGDFGFGDFVFSIPPNTSYYTTRLDLVDSLGVFVDVIAGIDVNNNKGFWILQSIDPATGVEATDPNLGFLLVNDSITHKGEGFVSFTQKAKSNTVTGDTLQAIGYIVFDQNEAIVTNTWKNLIDAVPPTSQVEPLPAETDSSWININLSGTDDAGGSGLKNFILYYSENEGSFQYYGEYTAGDTVIFSGTPGKSYSFFSIARDNVGNVEAMKTTAETAIHFSQFTPVITGQLTYDNANSTPMNNTLLTLKSSAGTMIDTSRTNPAGAYTLRPFVPGTYSISAAITKPWGGVNSTDALMALRHFSEITPLSGNKLIAADVNASGLVNAVDALLIARRFTQYINSFAAGNWYYTRDSVDFIDSMVTNNIKAICMGDADGSYVPVNTKPDPAVRLFPENTMTVNPGQEFEIPVGIDKSQTIGAISLVLHFPSELVEMTGMRANSEKEGNMVYAVYGNELRIAWYSLEPIKIENKGTVLFLKVKAKNLTSTMIGVLTLGSDCSIADASAKEIPHVNLFIPKIKIDIPMDFFILGNRPNPFNTVTSIEYGLPEKGRVSLKVYNALGAVVSVLVDETRETGRYTVEFSGKDLPDGVYYARITIEGESREFAKAIPMVLLR